MTRKATTHIVGPGEVKLTGETGLTAKPGLTGAIGAGLKSETGAGETKNKVEQFDQAGRKLADQHEQWRGDKIGIALKEIFPPDGVVPERDQLPNAELKKRVLGQWRPEWGPFPSDISIYRKAGRAKR